VGHISEDALGHSPRTTAIRRTAKVDRRVDPVVLSWVVPVDTWKIEASREIRGRPSVEGVGEARAVQHAVILFADGLHVPRLATVERVQAQAFAPIVAQGQHPPLVRGDEVQGLVRALPLLWDSHLDPGRRLRCRAKRHEWN